MVIPELDSGFFIVDTVFNAGGLETVSEEDAPE